MSSITRHFFYHSNYFQNNIDLKKEKKQIFITHFQIKIDENCRVEIWLAIGVVVGRSMWDALKFPKSIGAKSLKILCSHSHPHPRLKECIYFYYNCVDSQYIF